jgi:hypothetical protein
MASLPLPLAHILAAEDARLYGDGQPQERRWFLRDVEVIDCRALAQKLTERLGDDAPENISRWREESGHDPGYRKKVVDEVNALLESIGAERWLYEHPAFQDAAEKPYSDLSDAEYFKPDEVFNLNREMFDRLFRDQVSSAADTRFKDLVKGIHERARKGTPRTALALSGGGIRSATYALGVIQGLARRHVLEKFDFLSTISGGGYIGGWLSSWVRRDPFGIRGVSEQLSMEPNDPLDPEPLPIKHLRAYSNYLTPRLGLFSADTWALAATYLRNVLLNWLVLIPLLAGLLAVPRLVLSAVVRQPRGPEAAYGWAIGLLLLLAGFGVLVWYRPVTDSKRTKNLTDGKFVTWCLLPLLGAAIALTLAWAWHVSSGGSDISPATFFGVALLATMSAFGLFYWRFHSQLPERGMDGKAWEKRRWMRILAELGGAVAAGVTGGLLSWLATSLVFPTPVQEVNRVGVASWPTIDPGGLSAGTAAYVCFGVPILLGILVLQAAIFVGASSHQNHDYDREWWARASGWVLLAALGWIGLSAITIYGPVAIRYLPRALTALGGTAGIFSVLAGKSGKTKGNAQDETQTSTSSKALSIALAVAIPIFVVYILAVISFGTTAALSHVLSFHRIPESQVAAETYQAEHATTTYGIDIAPKKATVKEVPLANAERERSYEDLKILEITPWWLAVVIVFGCLALARMISRCIGVNVFSMHAMYRNRLVRAYLGASRWSRDSNRFTGFDPQDNLSMADLRPEFVWWHSFRDIDNAIGLVANARKPRLRVIHDELRRELGDDLDTLLNPGTDRGIARPAFYQSLNVLIATRDLVYLFDPGAGPAEDPRRALRNRRFLELAFGDSQIYPSPMPLLCQRDIRSASRFASLETDSSDPARELRRLFKHPAVTLLDRINDVIAEVSLKDVPYFAALKVDTSAFDFPEAGPVHRMIDNRLRIDAAFSAIVEPLLFARPLHLVGICLNLAGGAELAWQERKGASFAVTSLASGNRQLGYRDTRTYGEISLGTAVTISGAAASPNMGYHTSPPLAFLMTLFNVRLGWWLGNPGLAGNDTYQRRNPKLSLPPLVSELTGNADDKYEYVYLSDGGHFDNLGLYEMVLRRVHRIVVSDGTGDPAFTYFDLGNTIRKIRIDLGIEIEIKEIGIIPPTEKGPGKYCAFGEIHYAAVDGPKAVQGELLYIKPVVYKNEGPRDVLNYATTSPTFPHETTADQFFSESQFESYRRLGLFAVEEISGGHAPLENVDAFIRAARRSLHPVCSHGHPFACT